MFIIYNYITVSFFENVFRNSENNKKNCQELYIKCMM